MEGKGGRGEEGGSGGEGLECFGRRIRTLLALTLFHFPPLLTLSGTCTTSKEMFLIRKICESSPVQLCAFLVIAVQTSEG